MLLLGVLQAQAAGVVAGSYDLLETQVLSSSAASVSFTGLSTYAADYQHLQIRLVAQTDRPSFPNDNAEIRFNGDSGTNYTTHNLSGQGSSVYSGAGVNETKILARSTGASGGGGNFGAIIIDILDPFETTKYTTTRSIGGYATALVELDSGLWRNTAAITSINIDQSVGSNFLTGSRFSLYGIKAA